MEIDKDFINKIKINPLLDTLVLEDISDDEYFSKKYSDYISNSRLGILKSKGAKAFFEGIKSEYNSSFETGTLIHTMCLQGNDYEIIEGVYKPTAKAGLMADALYKSDGTIPTDDEIKSMSYKVGYYKDKLTSNRLKEFRLKAEPYWRDRYLYEQNNPPGEKVRLYTDEKNFDITKNCINTLSNNKDIQSLLHPSGIVEEPISKNERTIIMHVLMKADGYDEKVYKLKAKLDNFTIDTEEEVITVNDLKTTSRPVNIFDPTYYSYQREIAGYSWLLKQTSKKFFNLDNPKIKGNFLVVSTIPEYNTLVYPMTPKLFKSGWNEYLFLLKSVYYLNVVKGYNFA